MESSLADTYWDVIGGVGFDLGWGRGPRFGDEEWDANKTNTLKWIVKSGLRQFYHPPPDQSGVSHQWSFLSPVSTLTILSGEQSANLPGDFKGFEGDILITTGSGLAPFSVSVGGGVRAKYAAYPSSTGRPEYFEVEPIKGTERSHGQRFRLAVWPEADQDYAIQFRYSILGSMLTGDLPYAYGGAEHAETILASCLAVAEERLDDIANGPRYQKWRERLAASISMDRQKRPLSLGYVGDASDLYESGYGSGGVRYSNWPIISSNGLTPE